MERGRFIVFEGIDGSGTTTQSKLMAEWLREQGLCAHHTFEPSSGRIGSMIRDFLGGSVDAPDADRHFHCLALLFAADRLDHLAREVEPRLAAGEYVVSDRYLLSSLVYQSLHCDAEWVEALNSQAIAPDLTFLLDVPVEMAMERIARRNLFTQNDIYETSELQKRIYDSYRKTAAEKYDGHGVIVIDGSLDPDEVHRKARSKLSPLSSGIGEE